MVGAVPEGKTASARPFMVDDLCAKGVVVLVAVHVSVSSVALAFAKMSTLNCRGMQGIICKQACSTVLLVNGTVQICLSCG